MLGGCGEWNEGTENKVPCLLDWRGPGPDGENTRAAEGVEGQLQAPWLAWRYWMQPYSGVQLLRGVRLRGTASVEGSGQGECTELSRSAPMSRLVTGLHFRPGNSCRYGRCEEGQQRDVFTGYWCVNEACAPLYYEGSYLTTRPYLISPCSFKFYACSQRE